MHYVRFIIITETIFFLYGNRDYVTPPLVAWTIPTEMCLHISKHMLRHIIIILTYSSIALISSSLDMDMSENISDNPSSS